MTSQTLIWYHIQVAEGTGENSDCGNNTSSGSECSEDELYVRNV